MKSEIIQEVEDNINQMQKLIENQSFKVKDANRFLKRYFNILRKMEQLTESRDMWKRKCLIAEGKK